MSSENTKLVKPNQFNRSGPVHYRVDREVNGQHFMSLSVDYERAPVPERSYVADYFEISRADADVVLIFGKVDLPRGERLRNKIEIYFPFNLFVHQLWRSSRKYQESLESNRPTRYMRNKEISSDTEKVQTISANNVLMLMSAGQCMLDFFLISAKDLWLKPQKSEPIGMEALVRVFTTAPIMLTLLEESDHIARQLVKDLDIALPEDEDEILESI
jgi:hypothetical protein